MIKAIQPEMKQELLTNLRNLVAQPGWDNLVRHFRELLKQKELVKADLIRKQRFHEAALLQGEIDGISIWWRELELTLTEHRLENQDSNV